MNYGHIKFVVSFYWSGDFVNNWHVYNNVIARVHGTLTVFKIKHKPLTAADYFKRQ